MTATASEVPTADTAADRLTFYYDIGNPFYRLWLDETMNYSSALFDGDASGALAVRQEFIPSDVDEGEFEVNITAPEGTSVPSMNEAMLVIEKDLAALPAIRRALERGEKADLSVVLKTWLNWQKIPYTTTQAAIATASLKKT